MPATVVFVDVGQGNCTLFVDDDGVGLLVDCPIDRAQLAVDAARAHGLAELRVAFISHQDADHLGALVAAAEELDAREIRNNGAVNKPADPNERAKLRSVLNRIDELVERGAISNDGAVRGDNDVAGIFAWRVLSPSYSQATAATTPNHASVVLKVEAEGVRVLLPADADGPAFRRMDDAGCDLAADVLAVPHHGADVKPAGQVTGMQWVLDRVGAPWCVVSSGPFSQYGHPTATTVAALDATATGWYCTQPGFGRGPGGSVVATLDAGQIALTQ